LVKIYMRKTLLKKESLLPLLPFALVVVMAVVIVFVPSTKSRNLSSPQKTSDNEVQKNEEGQNTPSTIRPDVLTLPILDKHYPGEPDHLECYNKSCVIVWGEGENLCNQNTDCLNK